jgi:hypothetical protein
MAASGSILSFPEREPWGDPGYRGNCSGYVCREIFQRLRPRVLTDPMVGGGTSVEVAREMRIGARGPNMHSGSNILKQLIPDVVGKPSDLVLSHRPITTSWSTAAMCGAESRILTICRAAPARMNLSTSSRSL